MKHCVFTIVAKNYIGLGEILGKTLLQHNKDVDFYIVVADEFEEEVDMPSNVKIARSILSYSPKEWVDMAFKYNLTEFCTAIKPATFQYFFNEDYEKVIYFDPDIYIYSSIEKIFNILSEKEIVITPHICGIHSEYKGDQPEWNFNVNGIFNLGFCGARNTMTTQQIMAWWKERLKDQCFMERNWGQFTDQKWIDWLPALIENGYIYILRDLGMNLAPWNFFEREIVQFGDDFYFVVPRNEDRDEQQKDKLVFVHYSGFNYNKLKCGIVEHKSLSLNHYPDLDAILDKYSKAIEKEVKTFDKFIKFKYSYACFENGVLINNFHRRLYHGIPEEIRININPFSCSKLSFFRQLKKSGLISKESTFVSYGNSSVSNIGGKEKIINNVFKIVCRIFGLKRYIQLTKSLRLYSMPEKHTFLINSSKIKF